jgi:hypothetical protein
VERSTDNGSTFNVLGGFTSNALETYSFLDKNPLQIVQGDVANMYRLKIEDMNGTISYSKVATLMYSNSDKYLSDNNISIYPNPATNTINLTISENANFKLNNSKLTYNIKIMNGYGLIVKQEVTSQMSWKNDISYLLPGTYFIQVIDNNDNSIVGNIKFVKL